MEATIGNTRIFYLTSKGGSIFICTSVLRVFVFSLLTLGVYSFWWHYKNWLKVKEDIEPTISPFFRALLFPFYAYSLYDLVAETSKNVTGRNGFILCFLGAANFVTKVAFLLSDTNVFVSYIVDVLIVFVMFDVVYVQYRINEINKTIGKLDFSYRMKFQHWVVILLFVWLAVKLAYIYYAFSSS